MLSISAKEILLWRERQLSKGGCRESLDLLLEIEGGMSRDNINQLILNFEQKFIFKKDCHQLEKIWDEHISKSIPIQYLIGTTFWRDLKLKVTEKVLIPRPETELIIDFILRIFEKNSEKLFFAELGTGSGALSIALALARPFWEGIATDIDKNALEIASKNFINSSNQKNLSFTCGHWWNPLKHFRGELDLVFSNPPYIPNNVYEELPLGVKNFEPKIALIGGQDGLDHIREIVKGAPSFLKEKGWLILENHFDQGSQVEQLFLDNEFTLVEVLKDFSGIGRFTIGRYK